MLTYKCVVNANSILYVMIMRFSKDCLISAFWCVRVEDPFIGAALNFPIPGYWHMVAVKKSGCLFRGSVLMQMHAGIC